MPMKLDSVTRHLYKALLRRCSTIDSNPVCKALIRRPEPNLDTSAGLSEAVSAFLSGREFYLPRPAPRSAVDVVRRVFRFPHEPVDSDTAFEGLRFVNNILKVAVTHGLIPNATADSSSFLTANRGGSDNRKQPQQPADSAEAPSVPNPEPLPLADGPAPGVVLLAHPMLVGFFSRTVVLITRHDQYGTSGLCLNIPLDLKLRGLWRAQSPFATSLVQRRPDGGGGGGKREASADNPSKAEAAAVGNDSSGKDARSVEDNVAADGAAEAGESKGKGKAALSRLPPVVRHFRDCWLSMGGPVPGPNYSLAVLHSIPSLGGSQVMEPSEGFPDGVWQSLAAKECLRRGKQEGTSPADVRLLAGTCEWTPGQLMGEVADGTWVMARPPPEALDLLQRRHSEAGAARYSTLWNALRRSEAWRGLFAKLGGEYAPLAAMPSDVESLEGEVLL
eukprot:CAMPEP_0117686240 /NCGR_PEP_ID=MMETSP0804-20121206/22315_1 /TAXON_ID=1074897 /ORGANISM="Tetraselmis astigmatica, Strain CCMP880" /LENGTH=446 /DNA_ID=CAMNT_0005497861 /DNA_START=98 /DNA_END=1438 /DNA_ORIENTATION=-